MELDRLIAALEPTEVANAASVEIADLAYDTRAVIPGCALLLRPGRDGRRPRPGRERGRGGRGGARRGAAGRRRPCRSCVVPSVRAAMPAAADAFFGDPSRELEIAAVTGTNGKTTTAFLLRAILEAAGRRPALLTNIERRVGGERCRPGLNTPEAIDLQRLLRAMLDAGDRSLRDGGDVDRGAQGRLARHALRRARLHEPDAGPPRLPRHDGGLLRREARALRAGGARGRQRRRRVGTTARGRACRTRGRSRPTTTSPDVELQLRGALQPRRTRSARVWAARELGIDEDVDPAPASRASPACRAASSRSTRASRSR